VKNVFTVLILAIAPFYLLFAQDYEVSGTVRDGDNLPIAYANVLLLHPSDSSFVKGSSTDEKGNFSIQNVSANVYYIKASYVGSSSKLLPVDVSADTKIGVLVIEETVQELEEVAVVAQKPRVERKIDRVVFSVENSTVSQGSSWDILKQTPGVIQNQDELLIRNQSATVYINDRKVQLSPDEVKQLLESYNGENIKAIEVIPNPPANYDAEGGPVLNIITSKNISLGYKGKLNTA